MLYFKTAKCICPSKNHPYRAFRQFPFAHKYLKVYHNRHANDSEQTQKLHNVLLKFSHFDPQILTIFHYFYYELPFQQVSLHNVLYQDVKIIDTSQLHSCKENTLETAWGFWFPRFPRFPRFPHLPASSRIFPHLPAMCYFC